MISNLILSFFNNRLVISVYKRKYKKNIVVAANWKTSILMNKTIRYFKLLYKGLFRTYINIYK